MNPTVKDGDDAMDMAVEDDTDQTQDDGKIVYFFQLFFCVL